jgi:hypothetical protein
MAKINERTKTGRSSNICTPHFVNTGGFKYMELQSISKNHIPPSDKISTGEIRIRVTAGGPSKAEKPAVSVCGTIIRSLPRAYSNQGYYPQSPQHMPI